MLIFLLGLVVLNTLLAVYAYKNVPAWNARGFADKGINWNIVIPASITASVISSTAVYVHTHNLWVSLSIALVGFIFPLATSTDFSVYKIPMGISILAYLLPVPLIILCWPSLDHLGLIFWGIMVFLFGSLSILGLGLGLADVRLFILFGTAFGWWLGMMNMTYALLISTILQLAIHAIAPSINLGVKKLRGESTVYDKETKTLVGESSIALSEKVDEVKEEPVIEKKQNWLTRFDDWLLKVYNKIFNNSKKPKKPKKKRFHVPYGPSLLFSYLSVAIYTAFTSPVLISPFVFWQQ